MLSALLEVILVDESIKLRALDELRRASRGNDYLMADPDLTTLSANGASVTVVGLDAEAIHRAIEGYAVDQKNGEAREIRDLSGVYVIRTPALRFPNGLSYWIEEAQDGVYRVSLYSWSVYGSRDYGVNRSHLEALADQLVQ